MLLLLKDFFPFNADLPLKECSGAGVTAYSIHPPPPPPRKRAPAHKFAGEFVHHPRNFTVSTTVLVFAVYVPAYLFPPRKCAPCRSTDPELDCFVELSPARAAAHAEVIIGVYFLSSQHCLRHKRQGCRVQTDDIAAFDTKAWLIMI